MFVVKAHLKPLTQYQFGDEIGSCVQYHRRYLAATGDNQLVIASAPPPSPNAVMVYTLNGPGVPGLRDHAGYALTTIDRCM